MNFGSGKFFRKTLWVQKNFDPKINLVPKNFGFEKNCWSETILCTKEIEFEIFSFKKIASTWSRPTLLWWVAGWHFIFNWIQR